MADSRFLKLARYMDSQMVLPMRQAIVGRKLFAKTVNLPRGKTVINYPTITDIGDAVIALGNVDGALLRDDIKVTDTDLQLAGITKGYKIPLDKFNSFMSDGVPIDAAVMQSSAYKVAKLEDTLLVQGWAPDGSTYVLKGIYQSAGNTDATSADFATFGNPTKAVAAALSKLFEDNVVGVNFNLLLNYVQFNELLASLSSYGIAEMPKVLEQINPVPGASRGGIMWSPDITAGTGVLSPVDPAGAYIDLVLGQDAKNVFGVDSKLGDDSPIYGHVRECLVPRIKQTVSICSMTGI